MTARPGPSAARGRPGSEGIWTFIFLDMIVFALIFLVYLSERWRLPAVFLASQHALKPLVGLASTVFLLSSSWCMAEAVGAVRAAARHRAAIFMTGALLLGGLFVVNKSVEYAGKAAAGITPVTNGFFTFYYFITGIHLAHVIGGMIFMLSLRVRLAAEIGNAAYTRNAEDVGLFWHFVDVLWLFIFPLLYLARLR